MSQDSEKLQQHPIGKLFPVPDIDTLDKMMRKVLKTEGIPKDEPVVLFEGKVIERWYEYSTCFEFKFPVKTVEYEGTLEDLVELLLSKNTHQLDKQHRAFIGAYLKKIYREKARANQIAAGMGESFIPKYHSRDEAAKRMKISPRMVTHAEAIINSNQELLIDLVLGGFLSISRGADIANLEEDKLNSFMENLEKEIAKKTVMFSDSETALMDLAHGQYEEDVRYIKSIYKDKRQVLNLDMRKRISLADTPEEEEQLKQDRKDALKDLAEFQKINLEKAKLKHEKKREEYLKVIASCTHKSKKTAVTELVHEALGRDREYIVYMQWDYELGEIQLRAVYGKTKLYDTETDIVTLSSGRNIRFKSEGIGTTHTADYAKDICDNINKQKFCRNHRIFKPNSIQQKVYNRVGSDFMEKARELISE